MTSFESFLYTYDDLGNRLTKTDSEGLHTYQYDGLNQLTGVTGPSLESYDYDALGNRTTSHLSTTYQYDLLNHLLEDDTFTYTYDENGNLKTKTEKATNETTTYTYDSENQLIRIDFPSGGFSECRYDGLGRRIEKNVNGQITRYIYDGEDILLEYNELNQLQTSYTHGPGIDEPLAMARDLNQNGTFESDEHFFYHTDALGSTTALTDFLGQVVESYLYDSFGNPIIFDQSAIPIPQSAIQNPFTFTGREYDPESGLYYFRSRYYDPVVGRFVSEDPLSVSDGINRYSYVENNPINFKDPSGEILIAAEAILTTTFLLLAGAVIIGTNPATQGFIRGLSDAVRQGFLLLSSPCKRNPAQDKRLSSGEIKKLQKRGINPEELKDLGPGGKGDLYKDPQGNVYVKPKNGTGPGEPTGVNIKN